MKNRKYKSIIHCVTVDINPLLPDVSYMIEYSSGKTRYLYQYDMDKMSYDFSQRIHNFINTGILVFHDSTMSSYKYGLQNIID